MLHKEGRHLAVQVRYSLGSRLLYTHAQVHIQTEARVTECFLYVLGLGTSHPLLLDLLLAYSILSIILFHPVFLFCLC